MYAHKRNLYYEEEFKIRENAKTNSKKRIRNKRKEKRAITAGQSFLKKVSHKKKNYVLFLVLYNGNKKCFAENKQKQVFLIALLGF